MHLIMAGRRLSELGSLATRTSGGPLEGPLGASGSVGPDEASGGRQKNEEAAEVGWVAPCALPRVYGLGFRSFCGRILGTMCRVSDRQ